MSICPVSVGMINLNRIIGLNWNLTHLLKAQKEWTSSITSDSWPMGLVLSIKNFFMKIKNSPQILQVRKNKLKKNLFFLTVFFIFRHWVENCNIVA